MRIASWAVLIALNIGSVSFAQAPGRYPPQTTSGTGYTGVPYSATETTTNVLTGTDGVQHTQTSVQLLWRDAQGRTRRESIQHDALGVESRSVIITDPVAGVYLKWTVRYDSTNKIASIWPLSEAQKITAPPPLPHLTAPDLVPRIIGPDCGCERLGLQDINGEYAEGSRTKHTVRATVAGGQDHVVTNENWISPELRIILRHITDDPVEGVTTTNVIDVVRGDPSSDLFAAPEGYEIRDRRQSPTPAR
jgi:hypothetical protein